VVFCSSEPPRVLLLTEARLSQMRHRSEQFGRLVVRRCSDGKALGARCYWALKKLDLCHREAPVYHGLGVGIVRIPQCYFQLHAVLKATGFIGAEHEDNNV